MISYTETSRSTDHYTVKCLCRRIANLEGTGWRISFMLPLRSRLCKSATQTLITCVIHHHPFCLTPRILRRRLRWQRGHVDFSALLNGDGPIAVDCIGVRKHISLLSLLDQPSGNVNANSDWEVSLASRPRPPFFYRTDGSPNCHVRENCVSHAMSHLVSLHGRSSRSRLSQPPVFLSALSPAAYVASVIDCWVKLDMFRREAEEESRWKKRDRHCGSCSAGMPFAQRGTCRDISSAAPLRRRAVQ